MLAPLDYLQPESALELHSHDPWLIARYQQQLEKTAMHHLVREGFECWTPSYKDVRQMPLRRIPPKKRRQAAMFVEQVRKKRFPGYIFIRRAAGHFDVNRLFDLRGCGAVVTVSGMPAHVPDLDIELMRLAESDGTHDVYTFHGRAIAHLKVTHLDGDTDIKAQWDTISPRKMLLDDSGKLSLTVDAFGRVARLIAQADAL